MVYPKVLFPPNFIINAMVSLKEHHFMNIDPDSNI